MILGLSYSVCIWISAAVAITYTLLGGLYSVAYTDIIQLTLVFFSLVNSSPCPQNENSLNHRYNSNNLGACCHFQLFQSCCSLSPTLSLFLSLGGVNIYCDG